MDTEVVEIKNEKGYNRFGEEVIACALCGVGKTTMLGTRRCDGCWELESRIRSDPKLAAKILFGNDPVVVETLEEADTTICNLCRRLNPQHAECTSCEYRERLLTAIAKAKGE